MELQNLDSVLSQQFLGKVFKKLGYKDQGHACLVCRAWNQTGKRVNLLQVIFARLDAKSQSIAAVVCKDWNHSVKQVYQKELIQFNKSLISEQWGGYFVQFGVKYYMTFSDFVIDKTKSFEFVFIGQDQFGAFNSSGEIDIQKRLVKFRKNYEGWGWLYDGELKWDTNRIKYVINGEWGSLRQNVQFPQLFDPEKGKFKLMYPYYTEQNE